MPDWHTRAERTKDYPVRGADARLTIRRVFDRYGHPQGADRPTPFYRWYLLADGAPVSQAGSKRLLVQEARDLGPAYLAEIDARAAFWRSADVAAKSCMRRSQ